MMNIKSFRKGFSVTELIVMCAILTLALAVAVPEVMNALDTARQRKSMKDLGEWGVALKAYHVDYNFYPFDPTGPNAPIGPGVFLYIMMISEKYMDNPPYLDGWDNSFAYTAGGITMQTAQGYTIESLGKGDQADAPIPKFKCFQCDIRLRNGQFYARPVGTQGDSADGITCPAGYPCQ